MTKTDAIKTADKFAYRYADIYFVYQWTDLPQDPGAKDYHVINWYEYHNGSGKWIPETSVIYSTNDGFYEE